MQECAVDGMSSPRQADLVPKQGAECVPRQWTAEQEVVLASMLPADLDRTLNSELDDRTAGVVVSLSLFPHSLFNHLTKCKAEH